MSEKKSLYSESKSNGLVDIAYLAVDDMILVDKTQRDEFGLANTFSPFDNEVWMRFSDKEDEPMMTVLFTYHDADLFNALQLDVEEH